MAVHFALAAVEQVGREPRPGVGRGGYLFQRAIVVGQRHQDTAFGQFGDKLDSPFAFRCQGDISDQSAGSLLPRIELVQRWVNHVARHV